MRFLVISGPAGQDNAKPIAVYIEDGDEITIYSPDEYEVENWPNLVESLEIEKLEDVYEKQNFSYYNTEIGEYSGEAKKRIDKITESF